MASQPRDLPPMDISEARLIGRLCANIDPGYPPTNLNVLIRATISIQRDGTREDRDLLPSILRWSARYA